MKNIFHVLKVIITGDTSDLSEDLLENDDLTEDGYWGDEYEPTNHDFNDELDNTSFGCNFNEEREGYWDSNNDFGNSHPDSGEYNVAFQGKKTEDLIDQNKTISVKSAGSGPSYELDIYHDSNNQVWVARKGGKIAECITGKTQVTVGGTSFVVDLIKKKL